MGMRALLPVLGSLLSAALVAHAAPRAGKKGAPATPASDVARVFAEIERLEKSEVNETADVVRAADKRMGALAPEVVRWGKDAVPPLAAVARDEKRPPKTRLMAVSVIGLTRDPGAFSALEAMLLDPKLSDALRSEAAVGLGGVGVQKAARRRAFCKALEDEALPPQTLREAMLAAAKLGCDDAGVLEKRARLLGQRMKEPDAAKARLMLEALGRSPSVEAGKALWRLFGDYPTGSSERGAALSALLADDARLRALGDDENEPRALKALREEGPAPANAVLATRLAARLGTPSCVKALRRELRNGDPAVLAEAAEGLARLKDAGAREDLEALVAGAHADQRFAPKPGRPDPALQLSRLQAALAKMP